MNSQKIVFYSSLAILIIMGFVFFAGRSPSPSSPESQISKSKSFSSPQTTKTYSLTEVARHNSESSCWMAIDGNVYDVTTYIDQHPDGPSILKGCGIDATEMYNRIKKHDPRGTQLLPPYLIGTLGN